MQNSKLQNLLNKLSSRPKAKVVYTPKFAAGDIIINKMNKDGQILELICKINKVYIDENDLEYNSANYELQTLFNNGVKNVIYTRLKHVQAIDAYYDKMSPEVAQILYGIKVTE